MTKDQFSVSCLFALQMFDEPFENAFNLNPLSGLIVDNYHPLYVVINYLMFNIYPPIS